MVIDKTYQRVPVYMFGFFDNSYKGNSSLVYDNVINWAIKNKAHALSLGYCDKNLYLFKKKFGANATNPSFDECPAINDIRWIRKNKKLKLWYEKLKMNDVKRNIGLIK